MKRTDFMPRDFKKQTAGTSLATGLESALVIEMVAATEALVAETVLIKEPSIRWCMSAAGSR